MLIKFNFKLIKFLFISFLILIISIRLINNFNDSKLIYNKNPIINFDFSVPKSVITNINQSQKYIRFECHSNQKCGGWADRIKGF